ncbi:hypothetical protein CBR_g3295 [Chara braunii]|uniref:Uncharacterized protein n=1 Tax=Chara braunii TaxID=69332 RepID=A0A388KFB6_CHABU|nr:hypothetical protein CBR_g3295 [Chara braunii]|eukprot:GBG68755.1 hypothetical protein CBR_g3295 [Chara braunii]
MAGQGRRERGEKARVQSHKPDRGGEEEEEEEEEELSPVIIDQWLGRGLRRSKWRGKGRRRETQGGTMDTWSNIDRPRWVGVGGGERGRCATRMYGTTASQMYHIISFLISDRQTRMNRTTMCADQTEDRSVGSFGASRREKRMPRVTFRGAPCLKGGARMAPNFPQSLVGTFGRDWHMDAGLNRTSSDRQSSGRTTCLPHHQPRQQTTCCQSWAHNEAALLPPTFETPFKPLSVSKPSLCRHQHASDGVISRPASFLMPPSPFFPPRWRKWRRGRGRGKGRGRGWGWRERDVPVAGAAVGADDDSGGCSGCGGDSAPAVSRVSLIGVMGNVPRGGRRLTGAIPIRRSITGSRRGSSVVASAAAGGAAVTATTISSSSSSSSPSAAAAALITALTAGNPDVLQVILSFLKRPLVGLALVLVASAVSRYERLGLERIILVAAARCFVQVIVLGFVLKFVFEKAGVFWMASLITLMVLIAGQTGGKRAGRVPHSRLIITLAVISAVAITLSICSFCGLYPRQPRYIIPMAGYAIGNSMSVTGSCLTFLANYLEAERGLVEASLCLGATPKQASASMVRKALRGGLNPLFDFVKTTGLISLPGAITGMILGGTPPLQAVQMQLVVCFLLLGSAVVSCMVATFLSWRQFFTPAGQFILSNGVS